MSTPVVHASFTVERDLRFAGPRVFAAFGRSRPQGDLVPRAGRVDGDDRSLRLP